MEGLSEAGKILQLILLQIKHKQFDWCHWDNKPRKKEQKAPANDAGEAIQNFKEAFFKSPDRRTSKAGARTTWSSAYLPYLRRLLNIGKDL